MPQLLHLLHYDYVGDIVTRRAPHREAHLAHTAEWHGEGRLVYGGAVGDPPRGALFVFRAESDEVEAFVADDPYVANGLVATWRVEPWTEVVAAGA